MINEDFKAPNIADTDENLSIDSIYMKLSLPSIGRQIFAVQPIHGPTGGLFAIRGKSDNSGIEIVRNDVEVYDESPNNVTISKEAVDDSYAMFGVDALEKTAIYLKRFANASENEKTLEFLRTHSSAQPALTLSSPQNPEIVWKEISYKAHQLVVQANQSGRITFGAYLVLPFKYCAALMADMSDIVHDSPNDLDTLYAGTVGTVEVYFNPDVQDANAYVGLKAQNDPGRSAATFSPFYDEIRRATDVNTGMLNYFIFRRFAITANPLHTVQTPMMFMFEIQE